MYLNEYGATYENFDDILTDRPEIAESLLADVGDGEWQNYDLFLYNSIEDFAEYELTEGFYTDLNLGNFDFRGAPNPLDYIDLQNFGEALLNQGDESVQWTNWDVVVTTGYGW